MTHIESLKMFFVNPSSREDVIEHVKAEFATYR